jgi:TonB family protein
MVIRMRKPLSLHQIFPVPVTLLLIVGMGLHAQETVPPHCYGGNRLTREFVQEEMIYPAQALEHKKEGTVVLSFHVLPDGTVDDLSVLERVSPELDREAIRIFRKILWHPATWLGKPVAYRHQFEVKFRIRKYLKVLKNRGPEYFVNPYEPVDSSNIVFRRKDLDQLPKPLFSILDNNFQTFLSNNLEYPEAAFKQNLSGTVELRFVVETSGRISNIEVVQSVGGGCTEEAIRVLKLIKWFPGIKDNLAVRTSMPLQITFDIARRSVGGSIPSPGQVQ